MELNIRNFQFFAEIIGEANVFFLNTKYLFSQIVPPVENRI